ncbi:MULTISPECIES: GNAT family N-acetyltransferase [Dyella]|uniref:N-acetyltransferase n=2 Tax=Dyella TaxID=231454 RepID=A0A4R0YUH9_9GAMM|nr:MULTISPECIES: GNAT family N-acetyltransferase [Dyella]TBR39327.1 N-acetyltransferase [Dyella terrae]TCI13085.1 N-acetyltransferase [Dyella soli]
MDDQPLPWPSFPIPGTGVVLRPWLPSDAPGLYAAATESIETVGRWLPWCHSGYALAQSESWIDFAGEGWTRGEVFAFALADQDSGEIVGGMGLNQLHREHRNANLGYWIRRSRQGEGLAPAAVPIVARFGIERLNLVRVEIVCAIDNVASRRCAKKAGASFEGIARQRLLLRDVATDAAVYAFVASDFAQPTEQS